MFDRDTREEIARIAVRRGWEPAALLAVAEVESGGAVFATIKGRQEPLIRFEGHYFDRRVSGRKREEARQAGLADPVAGAVKNPASQAARWTMLDRAVAIDRAAALESVSWGLGQVMGAHWQWLGFASVEALVDEARRGADGQAELMARYIDKAGLAPTLHRHDWAAFARGYNGPDFARHGYDRKIAAAYARHAGAATHVVLRLGARGDGVVALQRSLAARGHALAPDGIFGPATDAALRAFQASAALAVDGIAGPLTMAALARVASPEDASGWRGLLDRLSRWLSGADLGR